MKHPKIGFGNTFPKWTLHIANRPELEPFEHDIFRQLESGEAAQIIQQTSNHWRKVFSIMAKISFALFDTGCETWQQYRDTKLLTKDGFEAIDFDHYQAGNATSFSIICGFQYAENQVDLAKLIPHMQQPKLMISESKNFVVTPYFDWRQLNNEILGHLVTLMQNIAMVEATSKH